MSRCRSLVLVLLFFYAPVHLVAASPNIILITLDTTRATTWVPRAPNVAHSESRQLQAKQSVVFTRAYSHVPLTTPSHATLLTGTYPQFNNISDLGAPLDRHLPYAPIAA